TKMDIPKEILEIIDKLQKADFEAYLVGGCVRDLLLKKQPKDWDITTNARPEIIQKLFPDSIYENDFGTVLVKTNSQLRELKAVEVTTFRQEGKYTDKRHPDTITFAKTLEEDLSRRDFTINAMALEIQKSKKTLRGVASDCKMQNENSKFKIIDPFKGQLDLKNKLIRAVGDPQERFQEDALRLMRAIRFACELNFQIETETLKAIQKNAHLLKFIARERIRDEFIKIVQTPEASQGILLLEQTGLLKEFFPEIEKTIGVTQNKHHIYPVFEHLWRSLDYASKKKYSLEVRLASLFHDIGKPITKIGEGKNATFYNHEIVSAKLTYQILTRLKFSKEQTDKIVRLVRYHGFVYDPEITTDAALRRLLIKVGKENIAELAQVREADRIGSGCPKAIPFRLRHFLFKIEKITKQLNGEEPSLKILKINGHDIMQKLKVSPGPKIGMILNILLEETLDVPEKNTKAYLETRALELGKLSENELKQMSENAKTKYQNILEEEERKIKTKYQVN
ncbi:MAG: CCA tRNA nucleotidyltransferase, partial [Minisyncoccia bacterium]